MAAEAELQGVDTFVGTITLETLSTVGAVCFTFTGMAWFPSSDLARCDLESNLQSDRVQSPE